MWLGAVVFSSLLCGTIGKVVEVFDVTTVYNIKDVQQRTEEVQSKSAGPLDRNDTVAVRGRVHSRTNARGLPVLGANLGSKSNLFFNLTCDPSAGFTYNPTCSWDTEQWSLYFVPNSTSWVKMEEETIYSAGLKTLLKINTFYHYMPKYIIFTSINTTHLSLTNKILLLKLTGDEYSRGEANLYSNCYDDQSSSYDSDEEFYENNGLICEDFLASFEIQVNDVISLKFSDGRIVIEKEDSDPQILFAQSYSGPVAKYFYSMRQSDSNLLPISISRERMLHSTNISEMSSPRFSPDSKELCLVVLIYSEEEVKTDLLYILSQDSVNNQTLLSRLNNIKTGWTMRHVDLSLPDDMVPPVRLVIRHTGVEEVNIGLISTCSPTGEDVEVVESYMLSKDVGRWKNFNALKTFSPVHPLLKSAELLPKGPCLNGGVWTRAGCACPPGFTGAQCERGCGRNRFGQDCGGRCSLRAQECEGLVLCTEYKGCQCASGFTGDSCNEHCSPGSYGNNCSLPCGHCAGGRPCDIYTGRCLECEPGFLLPYCNQESVYYPSKPEISSTEYGKIEVSFNLKNVSGYGEANSYQIQYRKKSGDWQWHTSTSRIVPSTNTSEGDNTVEYIKHLDHGVFYEVRVLLLDEQFNKYDGPLVQSSEVLSKCFIPEEYDYNVTSATNTTTMSFSWSYVNDSVFWCPLESYEVSWKEDWQWLTDTTSEDSYVLTGFLPGQTITFRVRAKTSAGYAPYSGNMVASTKFNGSPPVEDLQVVSIEPSKAKISWSPPIGNNGRNLQYTVAYKCVEQPACAPGCHNATEGQVTVTETSIVLSPLLPFTRYRVSVTPESGEKSLIYLGTPEVAPTEIPKASIEGLLRTNTSLTVSWDEVPVCSSFSQGYYYQLIKASEGHKMLASGYTQENSASFHNLTASTDYVIKVFVNTDAGWNPDTFLSINASTTATVPEAVQGLTVYKRGRSMLGLRWAAPRQMYGKLKSFTVKHSGGSSHTVGPTPCAAWPTLYCHTIQHLKANRRYTVTVSARNTELEEDSTETSTTGLTKESSPSTPENLKLVNSTSTSVVLQWSHPDLANGILRSFLINVEETEKFDQESCCQAYPLVETSVTNEHQYYEAEVSGLHPASTYTVSVSAKTVSLGPSQSLLVFTRPPHLPLRALPTPVVLQYITPLQQEVTWLPQEQLPELNSSADYEPLIKARLLLFIQTEANPSKLSVGCGILNQNLSSLLTVKINKPFYFIAEYTEENIVDESEWGERPSPDPVQSLPEGQQYQFVAAQVTEYNGVYNVDLRYSSPITSTH